MGQNFHQVAAGQAVGDERHTGQRHALAGQGGLGDLVGIVEVHPALGLQFAQLVHFEPALPGQPFQMLGAVRVPGFQQGEMGQVFTAQQFFTGFQQPGAGHGGQLLAKQAHRARRHGVGHGVAQGQVHVGGIHVHQGIGGINADVDVGELGLKGFQPGDQPHRRKRGPGTDGHAFASGTAPDHAHCTVQLLQSLAHRTHQLCARTRQLHGPGVAQEEGYAQLVFQGLDLAAYGRLGKGNLFGRSTKVQPPRHGGEGAQLAYADRTGTQMGLGGLHRD